MMIHPILAHLKAEAAFYSIVGAIASVLTGIGLLANQFTAPKVLAVMVFLTDWKMIWTLDWWVRMIIPVALAITLWLMEKRKHGKQLHAMALAQEADWKIRTKDLREDLKHAQSLLSAKDLEIAVLRRGAR